MLTETLLTAILALSLSLGLFWLLQEQLVTGLDLLASLAGRSFTGRSHTVRTVIFIAVILAAAFLLFLLLKLLYTKSKNIPKIIITVCLIIILVLLTILCFEQTIRRDDYWETHDAQKYGFPGFLILEFTRVNGRYFSLLLRSMYTFFDPTRYIRTALTLDLFCLLAACVYLSNVLLSFISRSRSFFRSLSCGLCLTMASLFISPKIWEVWFWGSGTFVYGVGITLAVTILALYLDACRGNRHIPLTLLCITCACGTSELVTASVCAFGAGLLLISLLCGNRKNIRPLILFTAWSFACTAFILIFSASAGYAGQLSGEGSAGAPGAIVALLRELPAYFRTSVVTLVRFFYSRLEYAVFLSGISFLLGMTVRREKIRCLPYFAGIFLLLLTAAAVLTMNIFMNYVPGRVITIPLLWIFFALCSAFFLLGTRVHPRISGLPVCRMVPAVCSILLCILTGVFFMDSIPLLRDIREAWTYRDAMILAAEDRSGPLTVCTIPIIGSSESDLSEDPAFETNLVTAVYYRAPQIIGASPCPPFPSE